MDDDNVGAKRKHMQQKGTSSKRQKTKLKAKGDDERPRETTGDYGRSRESAPTPILQNILECNKKLYQKHENLFPKMTQNDFQGRPVAPQTDSFEVHNHIQKHIR